MLKAKFWFCVSCGRFVNSYHIFQSKEATKMFCLKDFEEHAKKTLDNNAWTYISQGSERELTLKENIRSYTRYAIIPRMLRTAPVRDLSTTVLGEKISMPIGLSPSGFQRLAHPDGEIASSRAASEAGTVYTLSMAATTSLEDVAKHHPKNTPLWMQLYLLKDRNQTKEMIQRIELHGYKALVLTVDTSVANLRFKMSRFSLVLPPHLRVPNVPSIPDKSESGVKDSNLFASSHLFENCLKWEDVTWLKNTSKLPIVVKGILTAADALLAVKHGASAVWISNHGGRELDSTPPTLEVLPEIVSALSVSGCEIYMDGGIRYGSDALKAIALGARAVFIGRPALYGLSHSGQEGVRSVLEILRSELDRTMILAGLSDIKEATPELVRKYQFSSL